MEFKDRVVMITGGAGGLGKAFSNAFLERGAKVCICDINKEKGVETTTKFSEKFPSGKVIFFKCDVTKDEDFQASFKECERQLGYVDILINNAGHLSTDWETTNDVIYGGVVRGSELAMKRMSMENGGRGGHVINIGSVFGLATCVPFPFYAASKASVVHYTRGLGHRFNYDYTGVAFQCLCPGGVNTDLYNSSSNFIYSQQAKDYIKQMNFDPPMSPEEIVPALFKLFEDNKPGAVLVVQKFYKPYYTSPSLLKELVK